MATVAFSKPKIPDTAVPVALTVAMWGVSGITWAMGGPSPLGLAWPYIEAAAGACANAFAVFAFIEIARLARAKAERPYAAVWAALIPRLPLLALAALALPLFLAGYTAAKAAIGPLVGFRFDAELAAIDAAILGQDAWRISHAAIGPAGTNFLGAVYVPLWLAVLAYSKAFVALFAERRLAIRFFTAAMLSWIIGGSVFAYLFASAGPTFTDLNGLELRFAELRMHLVETVGMDSPFITGPAYLQEAMDAAASGELYPGAGISAMPSMHIAACTLYCLAARGTRWFWPAVALLGLIFVGSIHSGYHYAVDAPIAALIAFMCWRIAGQLSADQATAH